MIVVRAEQDVLGVGGIPAGGRDKTDHVAVRFADPFHRRGNPHSDLRNEEAAFGVRVFGVERGLQRFQIPSAAREEGFCGVRADGSG